MPKIILVTGASSGLGKALALECSRLGYTVYGTSRKPSAAAGPVRMIEMDVRDPDSIRAGLAQILAEAGRLDIVVNNAGIGIAGPLEEMPIEQIEQVLDTNVLGIVRVCQAVLPIMRAQGSGRLFAISSIGARVGLPYRSVYCASKAAVDLITESLRLEAQPFGVQVCGIHAGDIRTNINDHRIKAYEPEGAYRESFERAYAIIDREVEDGLPAEEAARRIARLFNRKQLQPFYTIGKPLQRLSLVLKRLLPSAWFERIIARYSAV